jgi:mono/diheme cytochrome c family protein
MVGLGWAEGAAFSPDVDWAVHCQGCHRADGSGTPGSVPALAGSVGKLLRVSGGRAFVVQVPGVSMAPVDDASLAAIVNWMLERFGKDDLPADFVPYTAEEVGTLRRTPLTDVDTVRARIMAAAPPVE